MIELAIGFVFSLPTIPTDASVSPGGEQPGVTIRTDKTTKGKKGSGKSSSVNWKPKAPAKPKPIYTEWSSSNNPYDSPNRPRTNTPATRQPPTADQIARAVRELPFPRFTVQSQPAGETLLNFDTILFTTPREYSATVTLLGYRVQVRATPSRFKWVHGDGTTKTTNSPGKKHPNQTVTHKFQKEGRLNMRVDTIYSVRYRIGSGSWQNLNTAITAPGPNQAIVVREATALLTRE